MRSQPLATSARTEVHTQITTRTINFGGEVVNGRSTPRLPFRLNIEACRSPRTSYESMGANVRILVRSRLRTMHRDSDGSSVRTGEISWRKVIDPDSNFEKNPGSCANAGNRMAEHRLAHAIGGGGTKTIEHRWDDWLVHGQSG